MASGAASRTVRLEVPPKPDFVVLARLALSAVCRLTSLSVEDVADLKLAITEAAAAFVGEGDTASGKLELVSPGPVEESTDGKPLCFGFELGDDRLVLDIEGPRGVVVSDEERELGRAIIAATVDECEYSDETMRLVKYLRLPAS